VTVKVSYRWHLRQVMAQRGMFATSDLVPLLASRGVRLSREQVYRLVAHTPERLSLATLAALCDIFEVSPAELIEPVREAPGKVGPGKSTDKASGANASVSDLRPRRARVAVNKP
jgi:DNA-binding Xre family transcriptional regulator